MKTLEHVQIICASKYFNAQQVITLYQKGVSHFGENRVDSFLEKHSQLIDYPLVWHFIGHLQRNKAKQVIPKLDYLHTLDSVELAHVIQSLRDRPLDCFIQVNATNESQKYGISLSEVSEFMNNIKKYDKINVVGFMTMGMQDDIDQTRMAFQLVESLRMDYNLPFSSMGMSDDYILALESNTTHVRLGRYFKHLVEG